MFFHNVDRAYSQRRDGRTAFAGPRHTSRMVPKRNAGAVGTSAPAVCLTIEGQGPSLELLQRLNTSRVSASPHTQIQSGSTCPKGEPTIVINVGPVSGTRGTAPQFPSRRRLRSILGKLRQLVLTRLGLGLGSRVSASTDSYGLPGLASTGVPNGRRFTLAAKLVGQSEENTFLYPPGFIDNSTRARSIR